MLESYNIKAVHKLIKILKNANLKICTAESCTGGLLGALITEIPGSSAIFERGYITYSNASKIELLNVPTYFIEQFGAVSMQTAIAMAEGALLNSKADIAVSITGIAGPEGATPYSSVGTVYIAVAGRGKSSIYEKLHFTGSRHNVRNKSIKQAMAIIEKFTQL